MGKYNEVIKEHMCARDNETGALRYLVQNGSYKYWDDTLVHGVFVVDIRDNYKHYFFPEQKTSEDPIRIEGKKKIYERSFDEDPFTINMDRPETSGNALVDAIVSKAHDVYRRDFWTEDEALTVESDIDTVSVEMSEKEYAEYTKIQEEAWKKHSEEAIEAVLKMPEAESDAWYAILSMGFGNSPDYEYELEHRAIKALRDNGHIVHIVGEQDSFGWVTRGIEVDGEIKALY